MSSLFFTCPTTHQQAPTGIETDVQSLRAAWKATLNVKCSHCGEVHEIPVRETYINGARQRPISLGHQGPVRLPHLKMTAPLRTPPDGPASHRRFNRTSTAKASLLVAGRSDSQAFCLSLHSRVAIRRVHVGRNAIKRPLIRMPDEEIIYRFQLSRVLPAGADTASMIALNRTPYERARNIGGYRMTSSAVAMSQDDWKRHYGPAWQTVQAAKTKFDPKNVLTPGHGMFPG